MTRPNHQKALSVLASNARFAAKTALPLSLLASVTFCLFGPTDMYFGNLNDFWFSFQQLMLPMLIAAICCFCAVLAGLTLFGLLVPKKVFGLLAAFIFGLLASAYVQGTVFSSTLETLVGTSIPWSTLTRGMVFNSAVWLVILFACLAFYVMKAKVTLRVMRFLCYALAGIQLLTGTITCIGYHGGNSSIRNDLTAEGLYDLSANNNVVVFLLDTLDTRYFDQLQQTAPEALKGYDGFTYYRNMAGSYRWTAGSMAHIFTNVKYLNEMSFNDYSDQYIGASPLLTTLKKHGYDVRMNAAQSVVDSLTPELVDNLDAAPTQIRSKREFIKTQLLLMAYRYAPTATRPYFFDNFGDTFDSLRRTDWNSEYPSASMRPSVALPYLASHETALIESDAFRFIYLFGAHAPYRYNAEGESVPDDSVSMLESLQGSLKVVTTMIERMKALDVYDQSTIVIMSDHGDSTISNPAFLIKYAHATGDMRLSQAPVSYDDLTATLLKAANCPEYAQHGTAMDEWPEGAQRQRFYYFYDFVEPQRFATYFRPIIEYAVPADATDLNNYQETGNVYTADTRQ